MMENGSASYLADIVLETPSTSDAQDASDAIVDSDGICEHFKSVFSREIASAQYVPHNRVFASTLKSASQSFPLLLTQDAHVSTISVPCSLSFPSLSRSLPNVEVLSSAEIPSSEVSSTVVDDLGIPESCETCVQSSQRGHGMSDVEAVGEVNVEFQPFCRISVSQSLLSVGISSSTEIPSSEVSTVVVNDLGIPESFEMCMLSSVRISDVESVGEVDVSFEPFCRICQLSGDNDSSLISPCRCAGSLQYTHTACLLKWIDMLSGKSRRPVSCELCHYQFRRHKRLKLGGCRCPPMTSQDKLLHCVFLMSLLVMAACVIVMATVATVSAGTPTSSLLTSTEIAMLVCGALFFVAFFSATFAEIRVEQPIPRLISYCLAQNVDWYVEQYDRDLDCGVSPGTSADMHHKRDCPV